MRALPTNLPTIGVACVPAQARMDHAPCVHHDGTMMAPHNQPWLHHQCMMVLHGGGHGARVPRCGKDSAGAGQEKSKEEGGNGSHRWAPSPYRYALSVRYGYFSIARHLPEDSARAEIGICAANWQLRRR